MLNGGLPKIRVLALFAIVLVIGLAFQNCAPPNQSASIVLDGNGQPYEGRVSFWDEFHDPVGVFAKDSIACETSSSASAILLVKLGFDDAHTNIIEGHFYRINPANHGQAIGEDHLDAKGFSGFTTNQALALDTLIVKSFRFDPNSMIAKAETYKDLAPHSIVVFSLTCK